MNLSFHVQRLNYFIRTGYWHTSERVNPDFPETNFQNHLKVYKFVAQFVAANMKVVDLGCGTGYGSHYLSQFAESVSGIDLSSSAIRWAKSRYLPSPRLSFQRGNVEKLPFATAMFDFAMSTENFEHLRDHAAHLAEVRRVLIPGGTFFLATPNPEQTVTPNPYHSREFSFSELKDMLGGVFSQVEIVETMLRPQPNRGLLPNSDLRIFGRPVDTTYLSNTHSLFCFCR